MVSTAPSTVDTTRSCPQWDSPVIDAPKESTSATVPSAATARRTPSPPPHSRTSCPSGDGRAVVVPAGATPQWPGAPESRSTVVTSRPEPPSAADSSTSRRRPTSATTPDAAGRSAATTRTSPVSGTTAVSRLAASGCSCRTRTEPSGPSTAPRTGASTAVTRRAPARSAAPRRVSHRSPARSTTSSRSPSDRGSTATGSAYPVPRVRSAASSSRTVRIVPSEPASQALLLGRSNTVATGATPVITGQSVIDDPPVRDHGAYWVERNPSSRRVRSRHPEAARHHSFG